MSELSLLRQTLDNIANQGRVIDFWWRDDDAVVPNRQLNRLLRLTKTSEIPITLAVIPAHTGSALADSLEPYPKVSVAVHGWSHKNFAPDTEKKMELGSHRALYDVQLTLARGLEKLSFLHRGRFIPVLVPPWNRIAANVVATLPSLGFQGLSTFGQSVFGGIAQLNTHIDVIDWKNSKKGKPLEIMLAEIQSLLLDQDSLGLLTHHLDHDAQAWHFIEEFVELLSWHPACRWSSCWDLLNSPQDS